MEDIVINILVGAFVLFTVYQYYELFLIELNAYHTDETKKKHEQAKVIFKISDKNDEAFYTLSTVTKATENLRRLEYLKSEMDGGEDINNILKKRDEHLYSIKVKKKKLKVDNISDDSKSQLNNDIERLTDEVDTLTNDFIAMVEGIQEVPISDSLLMSHHEGLDSCFDPLFWGYNDDTKQSKLIKPEEIQRLKSGLKYDDDKGKIFVDTITGKQYLLLYNSCSASVDYLYDGILNNKGFSATDQSRIDLNLSDETIQRLKDAVKDE